jgi:hypothetical protein
MEEPSWQIDTTITGDDVMAEDGLTFPLLQIGHRTQSSVYSMMHKCFQKMVVGTLQSKDHLEVSFMCRIKGTGMIHKRGKRWLLSC